MTYLKNKFVWLLLPVMLSTCSKKETTTANVSRLAVPIVETTNAIPSAITVVETLESKEIRSITNQARTFFRPGFMTGWIRSLGSCVTQKNVMISPINFNVWFHLSAPEPLPPLFWQGDRPARRSFSSFPP